MLRFNVVIYLFKLGLEVFLVVGKLLLLEVEVLLLEIELVRLLKH